MCVGLVRDVADAFWVAVCLGDRDTTRDEESGRGGEARAWIDEIRDAVCVLLPPYVSCLRVSMQFEYKPTAPPPARRAPPQAESFPRRQTRSVYSPPPPQPSSSRGRSVYSPPRPGPGKSSIYSPPPAEEVERDINPFEDVPPATISHSRQVSREERLEDSSSSEGEDEEEYPHKSGVKEEDEDDDDGSTFFPGSGLFGSGVA